MLEFFNTGAGGAIIAVLYVAVICAIFTVPVGMFNCRMYEGNNGEKPGGLEKLKAYVPFANIRYARVLAYGSSPIFLIFLLFALFLLLMRFLSIIAVSMDIGFMVYVYMVSSMLVMAAFAIWWILAAINGVDFASMLGAGMFTKIFCILLPPLGYYMLSQAVLPYFKAEAVSLNDTFGSQN